MYSVSPLSRQPLKFTSLVVMFVKLEVFIARVVHSGVGANGEVGG